MFLPGDVELVPHLPLDAVKQLPPDLLPAQLTGSLEAGQLKGMVRLRVTAGPVNLAGLQEWSNDNNNNNSGVIIIIIIVE